MRIAQTPPAAFIAKSRPIRMLRDLALAAAALVTLVGGLARGDDSSTASSPGPLAGGS